MIPGTAPDDTDDLTAFQQWQIQWNARDSARRKSHHEIAPLPGDGPQRRLGVIAADRVIDHIEAFCASAGLEASAELLLEITVAHIR